MERINPQGRHVQANSKKGEDRVVAILEAARHTLIENGYSGFTMRKIARKAGISLGNITYYYKTKDAIFYDLLDAVAEAYEAAWDKIVLDEHLSDEEKLFHLLEHIILDLGERDTTHFFPELWALANHDDYAAENMNRLYSRGRKVIDELIARINPGLTRENRNLLSVFMSASIEGHTPFIGFQREYAESRNKLASFVPHFFVGLARSVSNEELGNGALEMLSGKNQLEKAAL